MCDTTDEIGTMSLVVTCDVKLLCV